MTETARRTVLLFEPRFVGPILAGTKRQTIRAFARRKPPKPGDGLSLRCWEGSAYRSPQRVVGEAVCAGVEPVVIERPVFDLPGTPPLLIELEGIFVPPARLDDFARADGFAGIAEMARYYREARGEIFGGWVVRWEALL